MALVLNEEQTMLRDSARDFLAERSPIKALRALRDSCDDDGFSRPLWHSFAEMGFSGVLVPEPEPLRPPPPPVEPGCEETAIAARPATSGSETTASLTPPSAPR